MPKCKPTTSWGWVVWDLQVFNKSFSVASCGIIVIYLEKLSLNHDSYSMPCESIHAPWTFPVTRTDFTAFHQILCTKKCITLKWRENSVASIIFLITKKINNLIFFLPHYYALLCVGLALNFPLKYSKIYDCSGTKCTKDSMTFKT